MAYQSLYRRYRSKNFAEIKGQPHITTALRTAVAEGRNGHAYLFSGPRGTGKTSTARVMAKALNCENLDNGEPCTTCASCIAIDEGKSFDLHELDAASNNKVDDIRDLIAKVQLGSPGRTKVYILDEVHMLTSGAENALLKTLEEPPDHVVFVLATTEPHKVVPTIRSRTQHFAFHLLPAEELAEHVAYVVADAGLELSQEEIDYALAQGGGSARDTLSALDLVAAAGGVPQGINIGVELARSIGAADPAAAVAAIQTALVDGLQPRIIGEQTLDVLRNAFLCSMGASLEHLSDTSAETTKQLSGELKPATLTRAMELIGQALVEVRQAPDPRVPLEVAVLRLTQRKGNDLAGLLQRIEDLEARVAHATVGSTSAAPQPSSTTDEPSGARLTASGASNLPPKKPPTAPPPKTGARKNSPPPSPRTVKATSSPTASSPKASAQPPPTEQSGTLPLSLPKARQAFETALASVSQRARVRFRGGTVTSADDNTVVFAVTNPIHKSRCEDVKVELQSELVRQLSRNVELQIVVDSDVLGTEIRDPAKLDKPVSSTPVTDEEAEVGPVAELEDATDTTVTSVDRLTKAFPGSKVIEQRET